MKKEEITFKENVLYEGRILSLHCDEVVCPNGRHSKREVVHHRGGVCVLAIKDNKIALIRQFRYAYKEEMWELPAGKLEIGENPYDTGIRELIEEVGLKADKLIDLGQIYPTCGYSNEIIYLYLADNVQEVERHLDIDEVIDVYYFSKEEIIDLINKGEIKDAKTICAMMKYLTLNKEL